jgi:predicted amidohydrolase YtcJ
VLGQDPFKVDPSAIKDIPVLATYLGGRRVWQAD